MNVSLFSLKHLQLETHSFVHQAKQVVFNQGERLPWGVSNYFQVRATLTCSATCKVWSTNLPIIILVFTTYLKLWDLKQRKIT